MKNEKSKELWALCESSLQAEILAKAMRTAQLMGNNPYYKAGENGNLYEVTPDGKSVSPLILALLLGAPPEAIKMLLVERERQTLEWRKKNNSKEDEPSSASSKDVVV